MTQFEININGRTGPHPLLTIRPEYAMMSSQLSYYLDGFGYQLSQEQYADISLLCLTMQKIDEAFDGCADDERRSRLAGQVLEAVGGGSSTVDGGSELRWLMPHFCAMVQRRGLQQEYARIAGEIFGCGERKRQCETARDFIDVVLKESDLLVDFMLPIVERRPQGFEDFARGLARSANLVDDLIDMSGDYQAGEQSLRPTLKLRLLVMRSSAACALSTLRAFPQKVRLLQLTLAFVPWLAKDLGIVAQGEPIMVKVSWTPPPLTELPSSA